MRKMFARLWNDDAGFIVSAELLFIATILLIGLVTGLVAVRNAVVTELIEVANAIQSLDQSYSYLGISVCGNMSTAGSSYADNAYVELVATSVGVANPGTSTAVTCIP